MVALSERETQIISYKALGHTSKEIARLLGLEYRTVEVYFGKIKRKLKARNTPHAIYLALKSITNIHKNN